MYKIIVYYGEAQQSNNASFMINLWIFMVYFYFEALWENEKHFVIQKMLR